MRSRSRSALEARVALHMSEAHLLVELVERVVFEAQLQEVALAHTLLEQRPARHEPAAHTTHTHAVTHTIALRIGPQGTGRRKLHVFSRVRVPGRPLDTLRTTITSVVYCSTNLYSTNAPEPEAIISVEHICTCAPVSPVI